ncbi:peptidase M48 [Neosynechococcus sphagnicola sy1]|uniref:Peptidase M48 n=1 Tax=Neosynechococcus sphagnicola sy1 TaxID=1497020 RepID=A0A098TM83_9CYAN|nr:M48 family metallopeptidase [Neosynechococcus sphagnicola]KGF73425.1 peptidase M48 [Neosynechococcus sphagnicola sy1]
MSTAKLSLTGLTADAFRHPLDLDATSTLKQLPGLDVVVRSLLGPLAEQFFSLDHLAASILISEQQLPQYHQLLLDACRILDIEPPQLYLRQHPVPNAYTLAIRGKQPFIVLHTSLVDLLTPEEVQAVIAHELGHLKCDHGVYLTLANLIVLTAGQLPILGTFLAQGLQMQMLSWLRCAEFTCDRAALLVTQNPRIVMSVLMKLAGGSPQLAHQLNLDAFIAQARAYEDASSTEIGEALKQAQTVNLTHPVPVLRASEIDRWASTQAYQTLLQTAEIQYNSEAAIKGGWRNW